VRHPVSELAAENAPLDPQVPAMHTANKGSRASVHALRTS
jgi:hypothetical protein